MAVLVFGVASASFLTFASVTAVPGPGAVGSDLTILTHNDLYGFASPRQAATIVLSTAKSHSEASASCAAIGETLWHLEGQQDLGFLRYLDYNTTDNVRMYWIRGSSACLTTDTHGQVREQSCGLRFPVLCSQSASLSSPTSADTSPRWQTSVRTGNATVVGYRDKLSFRFLGLRYATIPARFDYSVYAPPTANTSALSYGPACIQSACAATACSEACLYLNIWTPYLPHAISPLKKKAVMLWIHGGGFTGGHGSDTTFDGGSLASRGDVVIVTINYRLSSLGFLALEGTDLKGNYGIADQIVALDWVRAHIEDFGGDKDRITVFGQSAGAASVRALLASPRARGKFSGAIMQSNPAGVQYASTFSRYLSISEATKFTKAILEETGCGQGGRTKPLSCLRAQDPFRLVGTGTTARYPVVDGVYLTRDELPLSESAPKTNVATMIGIMRDDGSPFSNTDGARLRFCSQYIVDIWTAFGREKDPNPKLDFLAARGFTNTSSMLMKSTLWKPINANRPLSRILDVEVRDEAFRETGQCGVLQLPLNYYSK